MSVFDIFVMLGFGIIGYIMRRMTMPLAPMLIAFILAKPFEEALRQALVGSEGSIAVFFTKPIAAGFLVLTVLSVWISMRRSLRAGKEKNG